MLKKLLTQLQNTLEQRHQLEEEYENKNKGPIYATRGRYLTKKAYDIYGKLAQYGQGALISYLVEVETFGGSIEQYVISLPSTIVETEAAAIVQFQTGAKGIKGIRRQTVKQYGTATRIS